MKQETYKIPLAPNEDGIGILQRVDAILEKARTSRAYQESRSVYAKLLMLQIPMKDAEEIDRHVRAGLPKAMVAGMCITMILQETNQAYLLLSLCYFESSIVTILRHDGAPDGYLSAGREFGHRIAGMRNTKGVEMFSVVLNIDLAPFVTGISEENPDIPFYGSLAGMNHSSETIDGLDSFFDQDNINIVFTQKLPIECFIFGNGFHRSGIVMVVFSGEELHVKTEYLLGWKPLGKEMYITKAPTNVCAETIDNIPATNIYQKYLNVPPDERFLMNICDFPMIFERDGCMIARTPPIFDAKGRLYFSGDVHEGECFRLSFANSEELLLDAQASSRRMGEFHPEGLFLIICPNRAIFLGNEAHLEVEPYIRLNPQAVTSYGPGEIYRYQGKGGVLNSSMLVIGMREGSCLYSPNEAAELEQEHSCRTIPRIARMATFLDATTSELRDTVEMAHAANLAKSQFLSNMSHEIRTPINAILGMDEMILRESSEDSILEYAENIRTAGNNLLGLINDILDFSKIESGKLDIIPVEYSLGSVLNDLINMIQTRADKKGLTLAMKSAPDLPSILCGDEIRLKQIITNILTNAVKYTERGFVALFVDFEPKDRHTIRLKVSVQDTGIGIKEADMKRLFSAFERIEEKRNRSIEGTGLGMNITNRLLALMNSKLNVKSVYGKGSTFSFILEQKVIDWKPMGNFDEAYQRSLGQRSTYCEEFTAPDARILVVDDTAMNLTVVKGLLKQTKVQIDTAENGYECLKLVTQKKYDIIFLDHRMPGIDGTETLKKMQKLPDNLNAATPVISLTADALSGARERYIAAGFKDYLTKPIDGHQLEDMMIKYLPPEKLSDRVEGDDIQEEECTLPEWLSAVSDLDPTIGIDYCGSEGAYLDALTVFAESIVPNSKEIAKFYETEDWKDFTTKVHALKSTARLIGANELSERAKALEAAGNRGDIETIRNGTDDLLQLYLAYSFKLSPLFTTKETPVSDMPLIDKKSLEEAYLTLEEIAASFDYENLMYVLQSINEYRMDEEDAKIRDDLMEAARKPDWEKIVEILTKRKA